MNELSSSDSERTISDNERTGPSNRSERKRKLEDTTSTGFGSGPAGKHHLRFTGTATATIHFDIDLGFINTEVEQQQQHKARDQAGSSSQAESDLALRLALPQRDAAGPSALVAHDSLTQLDPVPWEQAMQSQRHAVHDQADLSNAELSCDVIWEIPAGLTFEDVYIDYESHQGDTVQPSDVENSASPSQPTMWAGEPSRDVIWWSKGSL